MIVCDYCEPVDGVHRCGLCAGPLTSGPCTITLQLVCGDRSKHICDGCGHCLLLEKRPEVNHKDWVRRPMPSPPRGDPALLAGALYRYGPISVISAVEMVPWDEKKGILDVRREPVSAALQCRVFHVSVAVVNSSAVMRPFTATMDIVRADFGMTAAQEFNLNLAIKSRHLWLKVEEGYDA